MSPPSVVTGGPHENSRPPSRRRRAGRELGPSTFAKPDAQLNGFLIESARSPQKPLLLFACALATANFWAAAFLVSAAAVTGVDDEVVVGAELPPEVEEVVVAAAGVVSADVGLLVVEPVESLTGVRVPAGESPVEGVVVWPAVDDDWPCWASLSSASRSAEALFDVLSVPDEVAEEVPVAAVVVFDAVEAGEAEAVVAAGVVDVAAEAVGVAAGVVDVAAEAVDVAAG